MDLTGEGSIFNEKQQHVNRYVWTKAQNIRSRMECDRINHVTGDSLYSSVAPCEMFH